MAILDKREIKHSQGEFDAEVSLVASVLPQMWDETISTLLDMTNGKVKTEDLGTEYSC